MDENQFAQWIYENYAIGDNYMVREMLERALAYARGMDAEERYRFLRAMIPQVPESVIRTVKYSRAAVLRAKKVYWYLHTGFPGCTHRGVIEVPGGAAPDEIENVAKDEAFNYISWGWSETPPEDYEDYAEPEDGDSGDGEDS